ncbi:hypothetical protein AB0M35_18050 [Micromonospora sp. NPDC051196]|uniref:hypothetical protein n=1 Tax=Micromonospora sp. NPDC051196 TaxID=3155281 RepID=UPI0034429563
MFDFKLSIDGQDAQVELTATSRDVLMWEKTTKGASFAKLEADLKIGDLYGVAYRAAVRKGVFAGTLDDFQLKVDMEFEDTKPGSDGDKDPTQPAR